MNKTEKKNCETQSKLLLNNIKEETSFFKKPDSLETIIATSLVLLSQFSVIYIKKLKDLTSISIDNNTVSIFIKNSPYFKDIVKKASNIQNNNYVTLLNSCDTVTIDNVLDSISLSFNEAINTVTYDNYEKIINEKEFITFCLYFINYIIFLTIDLIKNSEIPSLYRTKYIKTLILSYASYIKHYALQFKDNNINDLDIIKTLTSIDNLIASVVTGSYVYLSNRKKLQQTSLDNINDIISDNGCFSNIPQPFDVSINTNIIIDVSINDINVCDVIDEEGPTNPIIYEEVSCESPIVEEPAINPEYSPSLISNAFIKNSTTKIFIPSVSIGSYVNSRTPIGNLDASIIYSPVEGYVSDIQKDKVYIKDIIEYEISDIDKITDKLIKNYNDISNISEFIKKYNVNLLYPIMITYPGKQKILDFIGIRTQHNYYIDRHNININNYNNKIQDMTSYNNIKSQLESNNVAEIKVKIDEETALLMNAIKFINNNASNSQNNTIPVPSDYELFDYYMLLLTQLNTSLKLTEIEKTLKEKITEFTGKRFVVEKNREANIKNLINEKIKILEKGKSTLNYFEKLFSAYAKNKSIIEATQYLNGIATKNKKLDNNEKEELIKSIMYIFNYWLAILDIKKKYTGTVNNLLDELNYESSWLKDFLDKQWNLLNSLVEENKSLEDFLLKENKNPSYGIVEENNIVYQAYIISEDVICTPAVDSIITPDTSKDIFTYDYWLKYMSQTTLIGAADILSWSTGLILPSGPVKLPVIYVPITPIKTPYGFILIGVTICGIYFSPFVTYNNITMNSKSIVMPKLSIVDEVKSLKAELNNIKSTLKENLLAPILTNIKDELSPIKKEIDDIKFIIKNHKKIKPVSNKKNLLELNKWNADNIVYNKKYAELSIQKFKLQIKYKNIEDYKTTGKFNPSYSDNNTEKVHNSIKSTLKKLDKLSGFLDKLDNALSILPTALAPTSCNFGASLKNPKLVVEIDDNINDNINDTILTKVFSSHKKKKESLMQKNQKPSNGNSLKNYYKTLKSSINLVITKEPYPTYDRINLSNLGFLKFAKTFVEKGSKSFGIPGQLPLP